MRIAVIGGGIAGLSVSYLLSQEHKVTLYEQNPNGGLDAYGCEITLGENQKTRIDVPFRIHIPTYYHHLVELCKLLDIQSKSVSNSITLISSSKGSNGSSNQDRNEGDLSPSTSFDGTTFTTWMKYSMIDKFTYPYCFPFVTFPTPSWLLTSKFRAMMYDFVRFKWTSTSHIKDCEDRKLSLGEYLKEKNYSEAFIQEFLYPYMSVICTCDYECVSKYPAEVIINFWKSGSSSYSWRRFQYGSKDVVDKLSKSVESTKYNCSVSHLRPILSPNGEQNGVVVVDSCGKEEIYDHVVIATQANHASQLLQKSENNQECVNWQSEVEILKKIQYEKSSICVHTDLSLIPDFPPSTKFTMITSKEQNKPMVNLHLNKVYQALENSTNATSQVPHIFETWNPWTEPEPEKLVKTVTFERPVVSYESIEALQQLTTVQGKNNVWFCGSYAVRGLPTLETAVASSVNVAVSLGVNIPWQKSLDSQKRRSTSKLGKIIASAFVVGVAYYAYDLVTSL